METTFQEIVRKCLGFIEANTKAVFQSPGFLQVSREQLTAIISSNKVREASRAVKLLFNI